jgi:hypothetical protein
MLKSQLEFYLLIYILFSAPQLRFSVCVHFSLFQFEFVHENPSDVGGKRRFLFDLSAVLVFSFQPSSIKNVNKNGDRILYMSCS